MEFMKKINEISKIVGKTASDTYNTVADKSGKVIDAAKTKLVISEKETEISEIYEQIGKTVYDLYVKGEDVGSVFSKESKKIDKILTEIEDMKKKLLFDKGLRICQNCKDTITIESTFCQNCGQKQKAIKIKEEKKETEKEESKEKVCSQCGLITDVSSKFCTKCGYDFKN